MKLEGPVIGERVVLATLDESASQERYLSWLSDKEVTRYLEVRYAPPSSPEALREYVMNVNNSQGNLLLGIFSRSENLHVGNIKLGPIDWRHLRAEVGILIGDKAVWGGGFASEAIRLMARYAFETLHLAKLTAGCYAGHAGSAKAFLKAGFSLEATLPSHMVFEGRRVDRLVLGLVGAKEISMKTQAPTIAEVSKNIK